MDRCALFVDARYALAEGALAVHGTRNRDSVSWDYAGLLKLLGGLSRDRTGLPLLRCYWYDAATDGNGADEHEKLADIPGVKLRLSKHRPNRKEGVEAEIRKDLTALARNHAVSDVVIVSAEEDLAPIIAEVQDLGVRAVLLHIAAADADWAVSRSLRQECDDIIDISSAHLRPYVDLISGAEPQLAASAYREITAGMTAVSRPHAAIEAPGTRLFASAAPEFDRSEPQLVGLAGQSQDRQAAHDQARFAEANAGGQVHRPAEQHQYQPDASRGPGPAAGGQAGFGSGGFAPQDAGRGPAAQVADGFSQRPPEESRTPQGGRGMPAHNGMSSGQSANGLSAGESGPVPGGLQASGLPAAGSSAMPGNGLTSSMPAPGATGQSGGVQQHAGLQPNGLPQNGLPQNGLPQNGLPQNGLPQNGLPQNGLPQNGLPQNGLPQNGLPPNGLPGSGLAPYGHGQPAGSGLPQQNPPHQNQPENRLPPPGHSVSDQPQGGFAHGAAQNGSQQGSAIQPQGQPTPMQAGMPPYGSSLPGAGQRPAAPAAGGPQNGAGPQESLRQQRPIPGGNSAPYPPDRGLPYGGQVQQAPFGGPAGANAYTNNPYAAPPAVLPPVAMSVGDAVQSAHAEGFGFGEAVARDAPALWLEAVLARKPRMPSDLEARLLQGSALPIDSLLHDEVRHALRRGFWDALERSRH